MKPLKNIQMLTSLGVALLLIYGSMFWDSVNSHAEGSDKYEYIIITTNALAQKSAEYSLQDLIDSKIAKGMTAKLCTLESDIVPKYIGTRPDGGSDLQTQIRNFITDYYKNHGTQYVLLVGDKDAIPPRQWCRKIANQYIGDSIANMTYAYYATDHYYDSLEGTWDENCDGRYGCASLKIESKKEDDGLDITPEVCLGRVPAKTLGEVSNFVKKTLRHNSSTAEAYKKKIWIIGEANDSFSSGENDNAYALYSKNARLYDRLANTPYGEYGEIEMLADYDRVSTYCFSPKSVLDNVINADVDIIFHEDEYASSARRTSYYNRTEGPHYYTTAPTGGMRIGSERMSEILNEKPFFVFSSKPYLGDFLYADGRCFGDKLITGSRGAYAGIMHIDEGKTFITKFVYSQYPDPDSALSPIGQSYPAFNDVEIRDSFVGYIAQDPSMSIGMAFKIARQEYASRYKEALTIDDSFTVEGCVWTDQSAIIKMNFFSMTLLGDPDSAF